MTETNLLFEVIVLLGLAAAALAASERLRLPPIAGFLLAGALAGPNALGLIREPEQVRLLTEFGVVFLLFEIGLELPLERLQRLWRSALIGGGIQIVGTVAIVAAGASALGLSTPLALVLGGLIAMSSTALVMRQLTEQGQVDSPQGQLAIAILILQDLSIVPALLLVPLLATGFEGSPLELGLAGGRIVLGLGAVLLVVRVLVPRAFARAARLRSGDLFSLLALIVVLGSAFMAEQLGLTLAVGAFLAGVATSSSPYAHQLFSEVVPVRGVLLGVFFTAVGMLLDPRVFAIAPIPIAAYALTTIVLKSGIVAATHRFVLRSSTRVGVLAGIALAQSGEFSFVLAQVARDAGLLDESLHQIVIAGSIVTLVATPFLIRIAPSIADLLDRDGEGAEADAGPARSSQVVLIGFGHAGQTLARLLRSLDIDFVAVDSNTLSVEEGQRSGIPILFGDATRPPLLRRLGVERARLVVVAISDPLATRRIVSRVHALAPNTRVLARTRYIREVDPLSELGAQVVVAEEFEASIELLARALEIFDVPHGSIRNFTAALREEGYGAIRTPAAMPLDPWLVELLDQTESEWIEVPAASGEEHSLQGLDIRARTGASVVAIERDGQLTTNPAPSFALRSGDRLLVLGDGEALAKLAKLLQPGEDDDAC